MSTIILDDVEKRILMHMKESEQWEEGYDSIIWFDKFIDDALYPKNSNWPRLFCGKKILDLETKGVVEVKGMGTTDCVIVLTEAGKIIMKVLEEVSSAY